MVQFLSLDEKSHAIDSLAQSLAFLAKAEQNPFNWKWFVIAFHNALYSFMLLALKKTDSSGIWKNEENVHEMNERGIDVFSQEFQIISFMEAFRYIQDATKMSRYVNSGPYQSERIEEIQSRMKELNNELRNQFMHFKPMLWAATPDFIAGICHPLLDIVFFLAISKPSFAMNESEKNIIKGYIASIDALLKIHLESEES